MVYHLAELAARLEKRHAALADVDGISRFRIAASARISHSHFKAAETPDFDAIVFDERVCHAVENRVHYDFDVARGKVRKFFSNRFYQIALIQGPLPARRWFSGGLI